MPTHDQSNDRSGRRRSSRSRSDRTPGAAAWVPERVRGLRELRRAAQDCQGCELFTDATQTVMGDGPLHARLMLVGEQPGDSEDRVGEPLVGPAGRLLDRAMGEAGLSVEKVYLTNAVKHFRFRSGQGRRRIHQSPGRTHVVACRPWLDAELELVRPAGVVLLGAVAGAAVHGSGFRLGRERGRAQAWPGDGWPLQHPPDWVLATAHPSAVLRSRDRDQDFAALVADLAEAGRLLAVA